jgi:ribonuclease BN (tRNA processing enzyme)
MTEPDPRYSLYSSLSRTAMKQLLALGLLLPSALPAAHAQTCGSAQVQVQILGSGGAELSDGRAASGTLLWVNGKSRLLIDAGPAAALRFVQSGAVTSDLDAIMFTNLRSERTADLPAVTRLPSVPARTRVLPVYGPAGSRTMPSTVSFVRALFDPTRGAWRHLGEMVNPLGKVSYKLEPHDLRATPARLGPARQRREERLTVVAKEHLRATAVPVMSESTPTLIWLLESNNKRVLISADTSDVKTLERATKGADMLVVANAPAQRTATDASSLLTPEAIGRLAHAAGVKHLVLTPRVQATVKSVEQLREAVEAHYHGDLTIANDLDCVTP